MKTQTRILATYYTEFTGEQEIYDFLSQSERNSAYLPDKNDWFSKKYDVVRCQDKPEVRVVGQEPNNDDYYWVRNLTTDELPEVVGVHRGQAHKMNHLPRRTH